VFTIKNASIINLIYFVDETLMPRKRSVKLAAENGKLINENPLPPSPSK